MANTIKIKAGSGTPTTSDIVDKELAFDRSADKLYINDNGSIVDLTGSASLDTEAVQDIVGAMFTGNTETRITATYQDSDGTIDLVVDDLDTDTQLTTENVQDIVGAMFTSNTETRISATYQDGDGTIDLVVDDMTADNNTTYTGGTNLTLSGTTFNVDDAFLINSGNDSTSGTITAAGFTTSGSVTADTLVGSSNNTNTLLFNDDQDSANNQVTLQSINHINIMTDGNNNGTGNFKVWNGSYDVDTADLAFAVSSTSNATFYADVTLSGSGKLKVPGVIEHVGDDNTYIHFTNDRIRLYAGGSAKVDTDDTYLTASGILDQDDMSSNSATAVASQQSIKAYVDAEVAGIVNSAPSALNTLDELAAALGDDENFATTTSTSLGNRLRVDTASQGLTGTQQANAITNLGITATKAELNYVDGVTSNIQTQLNAKIEATLTNEQVQDIAGGMFSSNTETGIAATYQDADGTIDLVVDYLPATDDRDVKPNAITTSGVKQVRAYFTTLEGLTGSAGSDYQDLLVLDTYSDGSGGDMNALAFDKSTQNIYHYLADQSDSTWGTAKRIAYIENGSNNRVMTASSSSTVNGESNLTFDGSTLTLTGEFHPSSHIDMPDDARIKLGASDDLQIVHTSSINFIHSTTSNTDVYFRVNDGGTDTDAIIIDSSESARVRIPNDGQRLTFGADQDMQLSHESNNNYIATYAGNLIFEQNTNDADIIFNCDDGSGGVTAYLTLDGSAELISLKKDMYRNDGVNIYMGSHSDQYMYYDGTNDIGYWRATTGDIIIRNDANDKDIKFQTDDGSGGTTSYLTLDGSSQESYFSTKLGIGTTNPNELLHINSSSGDARIMLNAPDGSDTEIKFFNNGASVWTLGHDDGSGSFRLGTSNVDTNVAIDVNSSRDVKITESLGIGVAANGTTGRLDCSNDVVAFSSSDKRLKENIKPLDNALDKVMQISGVEFDWKPLTEEEKKTIHGNKGHDVGVIAQEIEEVLPEVVQTRDNGYKAVKYEKLVPLLIESIKELKEEVNELKTKIGE